MLSETMDSAESSTTMQKVVEMTKASLERGDLPLLWSIEVARCLENAGLEIPSPPLAHALASCLFTCYSFPSLSAYLHHAMTSQLISSFHFIGLLTPRVLQSRRAYPEVYSIFLELTSTHLFHLGDTKLMTCCDMVVRAVDDVLQLSVLSGVSVSDFGTAAVQFILILFWRLMEATLEDWRTFYSKSDKQDKVFQNSGHMETTMEVDDCSNEQHLKEREQWQTTNWITAISLAAKILQNKKTFSLLHLAQRTSLKPWGMVTSCFQSLDAIISDALPIAAIEALTHLLASYQQRGFSQEAKGYQFPVLQVLIESRAPSWPYGNCSEVGRAAAWLPYDIFMEDVMVGTRIIATSVVEALAELVKTLQLIHNASWHDTFLALWISAVRLPQREIESMEGPKPVFGSRLSMPLSIVPLALALLIEEEEKLLQTGCESGSIRIDTDLKISGKRRAAFVSSLKVLGQFEDLLTLPQKVATAANQAAAAAATFVGGFNHGNMAFENINITDGSSGLRTVGNLRHLIVETCIARGLLDTSAYFWPGYVVPAANISRSVQAQVSPWKLFMDGAPLSSSLRNSLVSTPAKSMSELEKIFHIALNGSEEERPAAASILCGASLMRSWNVQEHIVNFVLRLLSPPASNDGKLNGHHLVQHASMLYATLGAIHVTDALHVLSLYGKTCELAAALLPICEVFGSLTPTVPSVTGSKEEVSVLTVFSLAFLILIKICKFHRAPLEHWTTGSGLNLFNNTSLEYLLVRYNMQVVSSLGISSENKGTEEIEGSKLLLSPSGFSKTSAQSTPPHYVLIDSFPRLRAWFLQQKSCVTTGSIPGVASADSVRQIGDRLLAMMLKKANKSGNLPTTPSASVTSTVSDDPGGKPLLPAWDLLAAVPFVVDVLLTACGHGKLQPRDLTTGLRELVDFCPASIPSIITFLEAEVTRGISRPAPMNGKDWPNPAANLLSMEAEIREKLSSSGVEVLSCVTGSNSGNILVTLPLPIAALLSLTIAFKVDKFAELVLSVAGPALQNIAGGTSCTAVVAALWSQKVRRWHDFIVFGSAIMAIKKDKTTASQVLKSCFSMTLGTTNNLLTSHGGNGALLGHTNWIHPPSGGRGPVPPGILFLRICPFLHDIMFLPGEIITQLVKSVREVSIFGTEGGGSAATLKSGSRLRCLQSSLATTVSRVSQASTLSASLLFVSGGSTLGQLLYSEALPAWFLTGQKLEGKPIPAESGNTALLEGYAVAYFTVLSGLLVWGGSSEPKGQESVKMAAVSLHMRFLASALDGKMSLACELTTWKAYVRSFISLVLTCASGWIMYVDVETLRRIAVALRTWHDYDLALALLESGGTATMHIASEFALSL